MKLYEQVMPAGQKDVLRRVGAQADDAGFYLCGGTAVAIRLGHRRSMDLHWFTSEGISDPMVLAQRFRHRGMNLVVTEVSQGTLHAVSDGVRLSFIEYRYPLIRDLLPWPKYECSLASLEDLACMKLSALAGRGARKDFIDVYALGITAFPVSEMLELYREKYEPEDMGHVVMSLSYFDDAEQDHMPEMIWDVSWDEIRRTIESWVRGVIA